MATELQRRAVGRRSTIAEVVEAGSIAGLVGGLAMLVVAVAYSVGAGHGALAPLHAIAATVVGSTAATEMSPLAVGVAGAIVHALVAIGFGVVFAALMPRSVPAAPAFALAEFAGVSILVLMSLVVLPLVNPVARSHFMWGSSPDAVPVVIAFAMHLAYGAGLSLSPWLRRRIAAP